MSALGFHQIKPALDPFDALLNPVEPPIDAGQPLFDVRQANFHVLHVADQQVDALFHTRKARLDLLQGGHHEVGDLAQVWQCACSGTVPQEREIA